jgi:hypothetical protein
MLFSRWGRMPEGGEGVVFGGVDVTDSLAYRGEAKRNARVCLPHNSGKCSRDGRQAQHD